MVSNAYYTPNDKRPYLVIYALSNYLFFTLDSYNNLKLLYYIYLSIIVTVHVKISHLSNKNFVKHLIKCSIFSNIVQVADRIWFSGRTTIGLPNSIFC